MRLLALRAVLALIVLLAGCGQKGPLYHSDSPPPGAKAAKPPVAKPVPYPDQPENK